MKGAHSRQGNHIDMYTPEQVVGLLWEQTL